MTLKETAKSLMRQQAVRKKLILTAAVLIGIQFGSQVPVPGVNPDYFHSILETNAALGFLNSLTGNGLSGISLFALSITPYITASIIVQLLSIVIPKLEELAKDGASGKEKYERITWIAAAVLGYIQSFSMAAGFGKSGLLVEYSVPNVLLSGFLLGTGALSVTLLARLIDKKGLGNGISLVLLTNILSSLPQSFSSIYMAFAGTGTIAIKTAMIVITAISFAVLYAFALFLNETKREIPVQYSAKQFGRTGGVRQTLPLKLCLTGVMPVIFAQSLMSFPVLIGQLIGVSADSITGNILMAFNSGNWFSPMGPVYTLGWLLYAALVFFFAWFYAGIAFNTRTVADNLKKSGATIPGIRPGTPTKEYLDKQVKQILILGNILLLILVTIPSVFSGLTGITNLSFGGTSILIITSVLSETKDRLITEAARDIRPMRKYF